MLEFLNINLPWNIFNKYKNNEDNELKEEVLRLKETCLNDPMNLLFNKVQIHARELLDIYTHLNELKYDEKPNYNLIK